MFKRNSDPITRDELDMELKGFDAYQKLSDKHFSEIREIFNDAIKKINFFMQFTNTTLKETQTIENVTAKTVTALHETNKFLVERVGLLEKRIEVLENDKNISP